MAQSPWSHRHPIASTRVEMFSYESVCITYNFCAWFYKWINTQLLNMENLKSVFELRHLWQLFAKYTHTPIKCRQCWEALLISYNSGFGRF